MRDAGKMKKEEKRIEKEKKIKGGMTGEEKKKGFVFFYLFIDYFIYFIKF